MEFDNRYGAVVCAQPPMNVLIVPFQWVTVFPMKEENLIKFNMFLCHLLYFPIGAILTMVFSFMNFLIMPFTYIIHTINLIKTLTDSDETMDELTEKLRRVRTIAEFILLGPIILPTSLIIDMFNFWYNLYTKPY